MTSPGKVPPEIIEVQPGPYLGEDDIVRLEDTYGRVRLPWLLCHAAGPAVKQRNSNV